MAIQRFDPLRDLMALHDRINRLFEESIARSGGLSAGDGPAATTWAPPVDLHEEPGRFVLRADVPGVDGAAVTLEIDGRELLLRGARSADPGVPRDQYLRMERAQGPFVLRLAVPESVDRAGIRASQRDGVLEVILPKKPEQSDDRRVVVPIQ